MSYAFTTIKSPVGELTLLATEKGLAAVLWENDRDDRVRLAPRTENRTHPVLRDAEKQLGEYFAGTRTAFTLPLDEAGTPFQRQVWAALRAIPYGETRSYRDIAAQLGNPKAVRAVGGANNRNPLSIISPCHRVVGANGTMVGYAGGLPAKEYLLGLETKAQQSKAA